MASSSLLPRVLNRLQFEASTARLYMQHRPLFRSIRGMVNALADGYSNMRVPCDKNLHLLELLESTQPRRILELGSGTTTATFNYFAGSTGASVTTIESSAAWLELVRSRVPFAEAGAIFHRDVRTDKLRGCSEFEGLDNLKGYDFVYVDGPPIPPECTFNSDIVTLLERGERPRWIVFDSRWETVRQTLVWLRDAGLIEQCDVSVARDFAPASLPSFLRYGRRSDHRHTVIRLG